MNNNKIEIRTNKNNIKIEKIYLSNYNIFFKDVKKKFNIKKNLLFLKHPFVYYSKKDIPKQIKTTRLKNGTFFKYQLYISFLFVIILSSLFINSRIKKISKEVLSKDLINSAMLSSLYENLEEKNNSININQNKTQIENKQSPFTIGIISINKINITYPIISECNSDLLKISPCKFYGVDPNKVGNCVIAGHNYVDNKLFSNLNKLELNDYIHIYDLSGKCISYSVSSIYEVDKTNTSPLNQITNGKRKITLITCNNIYDTRLIIEAYEV